MLMLKEILFLSLGIIEYWDEIVEMGTDMHRLKFHSKLLSLYRVSIIYIVLIVNYYEIDQSSGIYRSV